MGRYRCGISIERTDPFCHLSYIAKIYGLHEYKFSHAISSAVGDETGHEIHEVCSVGYLASKEADSFLHWSSSETSILRHCCINISLAFSWAGEYN